MKAFIIVVASVVSIPIAIAKAEDAAPSRIDAITKSARDMMPAMPAMPSLSLPSMPDLSMPDFSDATAKAHDRIQFVYATSRRHPADT